MLIKKKLKKNGINNINSKSYSSKNIADVKKFKFICNIFLLTVKKPHSKFVFCKLLFFTVKK